MRTAKQKESTKKRVLLVDDEPEVTQGLMRAMRHLPYVFFSATSGSQALELLASVPVDVVVADEMMPGMSGSELLTTVRQLYPHLVRIMLTGHASIRSAINAIHDGGAFQYLEKPCSAATLGSCIHNGLLQQSFLLPDEDLLMSPSDQEGLIVSVGIRQKGPPAPKSAPPWNQDSGAPRKAP